MLRLSLAVTLIVGLLGSSLSVLAGSRADVRTISAVPARDQRAGNLEQPPVRELPPELIQKTIQKYLEGEWSPTVKAVQVIVLEPSDPIRIPSGVIEMRVLPGASEPGIGRRTFSLSVSTNGRLWKTLEAVTDVSASIDVVAPNRFIKSEEVLDAEDLTTTRIKIYDLKHPYLTDQEDAIGKSTARPLQADTPLRASFLKKPFMVKKGDRVMIEAKRGGLSIQTSGITKSSGQVGQSIMVANLDSGRELRAKIVAPGLVQVEF